MLFKLCAVLSISSQVSIVLSSPLVNQNDDAGCSTRLPCDMGHLHDLFPFPGNCQYFCQCTGESFNDFGWKKYKCTLNRFYDDEKKSCVMDSSQCTPTTTTSKPSFNCSTTSSTCDMDHLHDMFPVPGDCQFFCQCSAKSFSEFGWNKYKCILDRYFDPLKKACVSDSSACSQTPTLKPINPTSQPTEKPKSPTEKPKSPTEKPKSPTEKPKSPTEKPKSPTEKPTPPPPKPGDSCTAGQQLKPRGCYNKYFKCEDSKLVTTSCTHWYQCFCSSNHECSLTNCAPKI